MNRKGGKEKGKIKKEQSTCPTCGSKSIRRISSGIWLCKKCLTKFTGKAYEP